MCSCFFKLYLEHVISQKKETYTIASLWALSASCAIFFSASFSSRSYENKQKKKTMLKIHPHVHSLLL